MKKSLLFTIVFDVASILAVAHSWAGVLAWPWNYAYFGRLGESNLILTLIVAGFLLWVIATLIGGILVTLIMLGFHIFSPSERNSPRYSISEELNRAVGVTFGISYGFVLFALLFSPL